MSLKAIGKKIRAGALHLLTHFAHWVRAVGISAGVAVAQVVQGDITIDKAMAMSGKEWAFRIAFALLPMLLALPAGQRNQSVEEIAEALRKSGNLPPAPSTGA